MTSKKLITLILTCIMVLSYVYVAQAEGITVTHEYNIVPSESGTVYLTVTSDKYIFTASGTSRKAAYTLSVFDKETLQFVTSTQLLQYDNTVNLKIEAMHAKGDFLYVVYTQGTVGGDPCIVKYNIKEIGDSLEIVKKIGIRPKGVAYIDDNFICRTDSGYQNITFMNTESVSNKSAIGISDDYADALKLFTHVYLKDDLFFAVKDVNIYIYDASFAKNGISKQDDILLKSTVKATSSAVTTMVRAYKDRLYVATGVGLYMLDIKDPAAIKNLGRLFSTGVNSMEINNGYLYVSTGSKLIIYNLESASSPEKVYEESFEAFYNLHFRPGKLYASAVGKTLVYDVKGLEIEETVIEGTTDEIANIPFKKKIEDIENAKTVCKDDGYVFAHIYDEKKIKVFKNDTFEYIKDIYKEVNGEKLDILNVEAFGGYLYVSYSGFYRKYKIADLETNLIEESTVPLYSDLKKNTSNQIVTSDKYIFVALTETVREYVANYSVAVFDKTTKEYLTSLFVDSGNANYDLSVRNMWVYGNKLYVSWNNAKTTKTYSGSLSAVINMSRYQSPLICYDISNITKGAALTQSIVYSNSELANLSHPYNRGASSYLDEENSLIYQGAYSKTDGLCYKVYDISGTKPVLKRTLTGGNYDCVKFIVKDGLLYEILQNNAGLSKSGSVTQQYNKVVIYDVSDTTKTDLTTLVKGTYQTEIYGERTIFDISIGENNIYLATTNGVEVLSKTTYEKVSTLKNSENVNCIKVKNNKLFAGTSSKIYIFDIDNTDSLPLEYSSPVAVRSFEADDTEKKIYVCGTPINNYGEVLEYGDGFIKKSDSLKIDEFVTAKSYAGTSYILIKSESNILVYGTSSKVKVSEITSAEEVDNLILSGNYFYTYEGTNVTCYKVPTSSKELSACVVSEISASAEINTLTALGNYVYLGTKNGIEILSQTGGVLAASSHIAEESEITALFVSDEYIYSTDSEKTIKVYNVSDKKLIAKGDFEGNVEEMSASASGILLRTDAGDVLYYKIDDKIPVNYNPDIKTPKEKTITVKTEDRGFPYVKYDKRIFSSHKLVEADGDFVATAGAGGVCVYDKDLNVLFEKYIKDAEGLYLYDNKMVLSAGGKVSVYDLENEFSESVIYESAVATFADESGIYIYDGTSVYVYSFDGELLKTMTGFDSGANKIYYKDGFLYVVSSAIIKLYDADDGSYRATITSPNVVSDLEAIDDYLYLSGATSTAASNYLRVYNLKNAKLGEDETPTLQNSYSTFVAVTGGRIPTFERCGDFLVADAMDSNEIQIINLKNRTKMYREGFLEKELSYSYSDLDISGNKVYAISQSGGLFIYELCALDIKEIEFISDNIPSKTPNGKNTKARIKIQNERGETFKGTLILASYEGNENKRLKNVVTKTVLAEEGVETVVETDALGFDNLDNITLKAMLFDGFDSQKPLLKEQKSLKPINDGLTIYVDSESMSSVEDGSIDNPYKSIESAKRAVKAINKQMAGDITVLISGGRYELTEPLIFDETDSGFNGYNVIYKAENGETPIISGGRKIDGWSLFDEEKGIYCAEANGIKTRQLYVDGKRAVRARTKGGLKNAERDENGIGLYCYNEEFADYKNIKDLEVVFCQDFLSKRIGVDAIYKIDSNGKMLLAMNSPFWQYSSYGGSAISYIENALELLDEENEFYIDTKEDKVYYKPYSDVDIEKALVYAPVLENLVTFEGSGLYNKAHNIEFSGIKFTDTTWMAPTNDGGFFPSQAGRYYGNMNKSNVIYFENAVEDAIRIKNAHDIKIDSCELKNLGGYGIGITHASNNITVTNNTIKDVSGGGVTVGEINRDEADPEDLRKHVYDVKVENNYIIDTGAEYYSSCAVAVGAVQNVTISHNEIANTPYSAVHIGWGWNSTPQRNITGLSIKNNYIHDAMLLLGDGGAIYTTGYTLADSEENPNIIAENYIEHMEGKVVFAGAAIYLDTGSNGYLIENNVIDLRENNSSWIPKWSTGNANNIFRNNFSTTSYTGAQNVSNTTVSKDAAWSSTALSIIENSGVMK